ncbi:hypothetical protein CDD80_1089 [Ophiocordyceps camponoti-rufipedis]|uniref:NDT80 domain-containing protein n=1 Tax=Ophiocordyceps camponoti-rufipedis TaxID=2004952 RepID=A0A2C5YC19_9HYPO|nr:hypothetical protein CDD80_1089 [Ophiocordyceps camponoti-rufipedis]
MAHAHAQRTPAPHMGSQMAGLEPYSTVRRSSDHLSRSPAFPTGPLRRHHPSSLGSFAAAPRMDTGQYPARPPQLLVPPLQPVQMLGVLNYIDSAMTPVKIDISGAVDKGPFLSYDHEWTCYRRNYLACVCSYTMSPHYFPNLPLQFTPSSGSASGSASGPPFHVYGFAMCISAVVADNEGQSIDLVQHTPKRDKGPVNKPSKIPMAPKTGTPSHHHHHQQQHHHPHHQHHHHQHTMNPYVEGPRGLYGADGLSAGQQLPAEHTFERIQFKHATLNNGKRRAAQQYYHLIVELWADVGTQATEQYVKVAYRKSAKMIVRGRSPGHYQNERRGSQGSSSGPGAGPTGSLTGYAAAMSPIPEYGGGGGGGNGGHSSAMLSGAGAGGDGSSGGGTGGYATTGYDGRGGPGGGAGGGPGAGSGPGAGVYGSSRPQQQHDMTDDSVLPPQADDGKSLDGPKSYQLYQGSAYDAHHDRVDLFGSHREGGLPSMTSDSSKVKNELDFNTMLPRPFHTSSSTTSRLGDHQRSAHEHYDGGGKASSGAYYPSLVSSSTGIHMTMA